MRAGTKLALAVAAVAAVASACTIPLGDLGGASSTAFDINQAGVVVGVSQVPASTPDASVEHAFKRLPDATMIDLGVLPGGTGSSAIAVNESGVVAGAANVPTADPLRPARHAVRWDPDGTIEDLGVIGANGEVRAMDDRGRIVGYRELTAGQTEAFVYDPAVGHPVSLPDLPGGLSSYVFGMNDVGDAVGYQWVGSPQLVHPVRWDLDAGTVTDLGPTWGRGILIDIDDDGVIVGQVRVERTTPPGSIVEAAILRPGELAPTSFGAGSFAFPISINDDEVVVGFRTDGPDGLRAFRWEASTGPVALTTDQVSSAWAVNDRGQIVGQAADHAALLIADPAPVP